YRVRLDDGADDFASGSFTTAPAQSSTAPFTFLVYGDNRTDGSSHAAVVRAMLGRPSDFLVHTGDFVEDGRELADWQTFFDIEGPLLRDRAVFSCVGNHELLEAMGASYARYFGPPAPDDAQAPPLYRTFRWANARFFMLNGSDTWTDGPEAAWLKKELAR